MLPCAADKSARLPVLRDPDKRLPSHEVCCRPAEPGAAGLSCSCPGELSAASLCC